MINKLSSQILSAVEHHFILIIITIIGIVSSFIWKRYLSKALRLLHSTPSLIKSYLHTSNIKVAAKEISISEEQFKKIKRDIDSHIKNLKCGTPVEQETAISFLLEFPSSKGAIAIVQTAVGLNKDNTRAKLICQLCTSMKTKDWYK